jgi:hypothetical protein
MGKKFWANLALCVILGGIVSFTLANIGSALTPKGLFVSDSKPSPVVTALLPDVQLVKYHLSEERDRMVRAAFVVKNDSDQDIRNIKVLCEFYGPRGKYFDRKIWLLGGKVSAGKVLRYNSVGKHFVHSRASDYRCELMDFSLDSPPFFVLHRGEGGEGGHSIFGKGNEHASAHGEQTAH